MLPPVPDVTVLIAAHLASPDSTNILVSLRLDYHLSDPYAVHAHFTPADGPTAAREVGRDLIDEGLDATQIAPAGPGDVRIWRAEDPNYIVIELDGHQVPARFVAPAEPVQRFLLATRALVPEGSESGHVNAAIDALLASILTP